SGVALGSGPLEQRSANAARNNVHETRRTPPARSLPMLASYQRAPSRTTSPHARSSQRARTRPERDDAKTTGRPEDRGGPLWVTAPGGRSADRDAQRLAEREVLLAHAEDDELLQLVRRREVARELRLGRDDLLRDLEVGAE